MKQKFFFDIKSEVFGMLNEQLFEETI